jgi:hypothetical protein|tara:strand:+ start:176 stop:724 length:549 start_codon:yes stop_codon:yes gene_type:complete
MANVKLTDTLQEKIRIEYVQGHEESTGNRVLFSLDELGKTHNVAQSTLYRHSLKEGWKGQRERFQENYLAELDKQRTQSLIADSKQFDNNSIQLAKLLMATVAQQLRQNQESDERSMRPSQLNALGSAALAAQKLAKLALGESTENVKLDANITDNAAFREAMELLDTVAEQRRQSSDSPLH